ncbi:uncharacterized protein LOC135119399 [Zophobas morio]|jgi:hypothetical protein|uniref:uncharacterized protein LOC135119399 n=1 Tax=Zophobas morio TaxID=2755281 RepID=UPI0030834AC4
MPGLCVIFSKLPPLYRCAVSCREEVRVRSSAVGKSNFEKSFFPKDVLLGTIKFIGKLGALSLVLPDLLDWILQELLGEGEDLNCLCLLLQTAGWLLVKERPLLVEGLVDRLQRFLAASKPSSPHAAYWSMF